MFHNENNWFDLKSYWLYVLGVLSRRLTIMSFVFADLRDGDKVPLQQAAGRVAQPEDAAAVPAERARHLRE